MLIGYARACLHDDDPETQLAALREAGCRELFKEEIAGAKRERPALNAALLRASPGDTLVVWKLDRLARNVRQLAATVSDLKARRMELRVLIPAMETTAYGGLLFDMLTAVGQFDRDLSKERTRAGLTAVRAVGHRGGRKPALGDAEIAQAKILLSDPTITVGEVARRLGVQPSTLYRHIPGGRSALLDGVAA